MTKRFDISQKTAGENWVDSVVDYLIKENPDKNTFTTAAGISPSGVVHFGNFRDVFTAHIVREGLIKKGKKARLIFSWDNFDRFRKVPVGVPDSFAQYIGMPLSKVPDPEGELSSYAERFQKPFVEAMKILGIEIEYIDQTKMYQSGIYDEYIEKALINRDKIADVLISFMTEKAIKEKEIDIIKYRNEFFPVTIYSRFTGKDSTKILEYVGDMKITYRCLETKNEETVDLREHRIAKLNWKVDWPMRWNFEAVDFEPGGADHASPGGSYDVACSMSEIIYGGIVPLFVEYLFVGIRGNGAKMSGSKGNAVSPLDLLDIYDPKLLKWLYERKDPNQSFELAFDSEIYRQYDEYDAEQKNNPPLSFRRIVGLGQIVQWDIDKLVELLKEMSVEIIDVESISKRLPLAKNWVNKYNEKEVVKLLEQKNKNFIQSLSQEQIDNVNSFRDELIQNSNAHIEELEIISYKIVKKDGIDEAVLKKVQRAFFNDIYNLLIGKDTGPRLGTFIWAIDRAKVLELLDIS